MNTVDHADSMVFTADGKFLIYDAYNLMHQQNGTEYGSWSIYALELSSGHIYAIIKPVQGFDIGFPSVGRIHPNLLTFDLVDKNKSTVTVMLMDLSKGTANQVIKLNSDWAVPTFTGDDKAIVYSKPDTTVNTGYSLMRQAIDPATLKPAGDPALFQSDADFGVVYRRGTFTAPAPDIDVNPAPLSFGNVNLHSTKTLPLTIKNKGTSDLRIDSAQLTGDNSFAVKGSWAGLVLPAGASNVLQVSFSPVLAQAASAKLTVKSDDPDHPALEVVFSGTGIKTSTTYTISVTSSGSGTVQPTGNISVSEGSDKIFAFTPSAGNHIDDVQVDGTSVGNPASYTFKNISAPHTLYVVFAADVLAKHTITTSHEGDGSIFPDGSVAVEEGSDKTFSFVPSAGSHIADVLVDNVSKGSPSAYTFKTVNTEHSLHVIFSADVLSKKGDVNKDGHLYPDDTFDILKLLTGQTVKNIDAQASINGDNIIGMDDAIYVLQHNDITDAVTYTVTANAGNNGIIFPSGKIKVNNGADQLFAITPDSGYHIENFIVDGVSIKIVNPFSFNNINSNHTISVTFAKNADVPTEYHINAGSGAHGAISPTGIIIVKSGNDQKFSFTPDKDYKVADVVVNGHSTGAAADYTFSGVQADQSISVTFKPVNPGGSTDDVPILLSEAAGGRYDAEDLMDEVLDIAVKAIWMASEQAGTVTFTGTMTQVGSTLNFTYQPGPADKMTVKFSNGNYFDIKADANRFTGYTKGTVDDFLFSHNVDFAIVSNTGINLRMSSNTWSTDSSDPVYDMSVINWQRRITGTYPDGERVINMDLTSQGKLQRSDPSSSRVFSRRHSTLTGTASSGGNVVTVNAQSDGDFSHDANANAEVKHFYTTNNSKITMGAETYQLNNYKVNWIMGASLNEQATTPFLVIESEKWGVSGEVLHNNQPYGSIVFSSQPVNNTKGPAVVLKRAGNTSIELFRPIN